MDRVSIRGGRMINEDLPVAIDATIAIKNTAVTSTNRLENSRTEGGNANDNDELPATGTTAVMSTSLPIPLGSEGSINQLSEELLIMPSFQSETGSSGDKTFSDAHSSCHHQTSDEAEPKTINSTFHPSIESISDCNGAPHNIFPSEPRKRPIAQWKILIVGFVSFLVLAAVIPSCIQDLGHGNGEINQLPLVSFSPNGDGGPVPVIRVQLKGSPLTENVHSSDSGLVISEFTEWSNYNDHDDMVATTEQLRFLIDLLAPIVSRLSEREGDNLRDYVASRRNDETIVLKGSPQHHALAWLSHAIVCPCKAGNPISTSSGNSNSSEEEYECMSLLSRSQLLNRYALATIYFAWNGKSWRDAEGWLSYHPGREFPASSLVSRSSKVANFESQSSIDIDSQRHPSDVCTWEGVTCRHQPPIESDGLLETANSTDGIGSDVAEKQFPTEEEEEILGLDLSGRNLLGFMSVVKEIRLLGYLQGLDLSSNHLEGPVPRELGRLEKLRSLDLSHNYLSGSLPVSISRDLTSLETIRVEGNFLVDGLKDFRFAPISCDEVPFESFSADCFGTKPEVGCPCCTSCCETIASEEAGSHLRGSEVAQERKKETEATVCHEQRNARVPEDDYYMFKSVGMDTDDN